MHRANPPVSVVITVLNDAAGLLQVVTALLGQTRRPEEIVVVDGGSTDGTASVLADLEPGEIKLRVVQRPGCSIAAGRNDGIRIATSDVIACTDAGCTPDSRWLAEIVAPFADPSVDVVGGAYRVCWSRSLQRVVGLLTMPGQREAVDALRFNPSARSIAFRRRAWELAGGFPEWLHTAEDTLFDCRLRALRAAFIHAPHAVVTWEPRSSWPEVKRQFRAYARGEARIGRGGGHDRFWLRRWGQGLLGVVAAGLLASAGMPLAALAAVVAACAWLALPLHAAARQVAGYSGIWSDYPRALLAGQRIALARVRGHASGRRDRQRDPDRFVTSLRDYYGTDRVAEVPPWRMTEVPVPRTLVMAWHWPPVARASTQVLANLFAGATQSSFRVLTRAMPCEDSTPVPAIPTQRLKWTLSDDQEVRAWTWLASIQMVARMCRAARQVHRDWSVQQVMAVYPHRYSLLAGWLVARLLGRPLNVYMHDLCAETLITRSRLKRRFWCAVDRVVLRAARLVIVPTPEFAEHYRKRGITRTWVLPHCTADDVQPAPLPRIDAHLRLIYAGSVYQAQADAVKRLSQVIQYDGDVDLRFLSNDHPAVEGNNLGWRSRPDALATMRGADVLVVALGTDTPYPEEVMGCFPSKLVDYLALGRPILAAVPRGSFVSRLIETSGCGVAADPRSTVEIRAAVHVLRDTQRREAMAAASRDLAKELDAARWLRLLGERLALGAPREPVTPVFPDPIAAAARRVEAAPIPRQGAEVLA